MADTTQSGADPSKIRRSCGHGPVVVTVPDTSPGMPPGSTRSESKPCNCGG
jgi:hypothetical protein